MKTKLYLAIILIAYSTIQIYAQNRTEIYATNFEISDNLDLKAVASIFGDSYNLRDFERRLNDPKLQISNLDLNNDNRVDYLRVIESIEDHTHIVIIQSVLGQNIYQDVATIEIEKDRYSRISIQIVGNAYMYGSNFIYEPSYYNTPKIYTTFWITNYQPYYSTWSWNYYPASYYSWVPYSISRYKNNTYSCINYDNGYNYVNYRRCNRAVAIYNSKSCTSYEKQYPEYAFSKRNYQISNRYELDQKQNNYPTNNTQLRDIRYNNDNSGQRVIPQRNYSERHIPINQTSTKSRFTTQRAEPHKNMSRTITEIPERQSGQNIDLQKNNVKFSKSTNRRI